MFLEGFTKVEKNNLYGRAVSLYSMGYLGIGIDIYEEIGKPEFVEILYKDNGDETITVAIKKVKSDTPNSYIAVRNNAAGVRVAMTRLISQYKLAKPQYQVPAEVNRGVLFATLRKGSDESVLE